METGLALALLVLATIFVASFLSLLFLCRRKSLRRRTARYMKKKFSRHDFRNSDMELVQKEDFQCSQQTLLENMKENNPLAARCESLLSLCQAVNLSSCQITLEDFRILYHIVKVAKSITNDSEKLSQIELDNQGSLLEPNTTNLVLQVSKTLAAMEQRLLAIREETVTTTSYQTLKPCHSATLM